MDDTKNQALEYIRSLGSTHAISREELLEAYDGGASNLDPAEPVLFRHLSVSSTLYLLGGLVIFIGIGFLLSQGWESFSDTVRILCTLGVGIVAYYAGFALGRSEKAGGMENAFFLLSALTLPVGLAVVLHIAGMSATTGIDAFIAGLMTLVYFGSYYAFKKPLFGLFGTVFASWFYLGLTELFFRYNPVDTKLGVDLFFYRILVLGLSYLFLSRAVEKGALRFLSKALVNFGLIATFGAALALGKWQPEQNYFWELIFPILCFGSIFASISLRNRAYLTWGSLFLIAYTLKITGEYFASGFGWPLALVIAGLIIIGIGFFTLQIRQRYILGKNL